MRAAILLAVAVLTRSVLAQQIQVSVCNGPRALAESVVRRAKAEVQAVFRLSKIGIEWLDCQNLAGSHPFVVRIRADRPPGTAGPLSLDAMGRAFLAKDGGGYIVDAYIQSVREIGDYYQADIAVLLGVVIAHELGHLLLGQGHAPSGVMLSRWGSAEVKALTQRRLTFTREQRAKMQRLLSGGVTP
jgi:hypothetical protein